MMLTSPNPLLVDNAVSSGDDQVGFGAGRTHDQRRATVADHVAPQIVVYSTDPWVRVRDGFGTSDDSGFGSSQ